MNRENQAQETLHPLNDDITKESNPKNLSVPADNRSNGMLNSLYSDCCCGRGDNVIPENERRS